MEQRRFILLIVFAFSLFMLWEAWNAKNRPPVPQSEQPVSAQTTAHSTADDVPTPSDGLRKDLPATSQGTSAADITSSANTAATESITVTTDTVVAQISALGGTIEHMALKKLKASADSNDPFVLLDNGKEHIYQAQSGLIGTALPTHRTLFTLSDNQNLRLEDGADSLEVRLHAPEENGVQVDKVLTFHRGSYLIDIRYEISNQSTGPIEADAYFQFLRDDIPAEAVKLFGVHTFTGPAFYTDEGKYQKVQFKDITENKAKFTKQADNGWTAMVQHYFVSAWLPEKGTSREFFAKRINNGLFTTGLIVPVDSIAPGTTGTIGLQLYSGPQEQRKLADIAQGLNLVVDYGWLTVIAAPLFHVLSWFHSLTGNWGWAIVLVTCAIKLVFFPLSAASYKSMAKMRVLAPRMQRLKELYGHDRMRMQQEMMTLYRTEKINPLGGCLPVLVQIPVFIALYWVLLGSFEMRHAPWIGWIHDLSSKDPYFILPIIMGASMLVQMKLNPAPPDPIQAKVMMAMPIVFTFMFLWFPSGLVLYWVVNNLLSIAQQWQITRMIERGKKRSESGS